MRDEGLPFLRGRIERSEAFTTARGGGGEAPVLPPRDPVQHRGHLIAQLDNIATAAHARDPQTRDPEATRELIAVHPEPGSQLEASSLGDAVSDVRVVGVDPDNGIVLIDAPSAELPALRKKLDDFADASKLSPKKQQPMNAPLIAPIKEVRAATIEEVGPSLLPAMQDGAPRWVELACRGGIYDDDGSKKSRREIDHRGLDAERRDGRQASQEAAEAQEDLPDQTGTGARRKVLSPAA